ncbi:hypothetical protein FA09DRAFT_229729 [Tilletiopsis washingtonensis]|jgi:heme-degrading monooxygenase HmoA|uniref:ABM domain-containing protein n=1 Tax=Tilletiopsis washingtonensis TaxID=58919 RepID=A0A316ZCY6_9BASI|nr:hypothetical protein FA09DRAFT_229729 [Tilletiopsis washingtonensis]PWN99401.1 hypothetical protein FA09DRAFT_229729 [Tilletiopsis washingtonensis]
MSGHPARLDVRPPYYLVAFSSSRRPDLDGAAYARTAALMEQLVQRSPGYLGAESAAQGDKGITLSYWRDEASIREWKRNAEHLVAQQLGKEAWYAAYRTRVALVQREYGWEEEAAEAERDRRRE